MRSPWFTFAVVGAGWLASFLVVAEARAATAISFANEIAPVLQQKCVTCHGPEKQKGGYRLDSFEWLRKAGESGEPPITDGQVAESQLLKLVTTADEDERMPQKDDPLPADFIEKVRRWIAEGAKFDGANPRQSLADLIPPTAHPAPPEIYPHPIPVLSIALLGDGRSVAIGGYHEVLVCELDSGKLLQRMTNLPERIHALLPMNDGRRLLYAGGYPGRAGEVGLIDLEQTAAVVSPRVLARSADTMLALAISPDGKDIAAGGADKLIRVINVDDGREIRQLSQHADWVMGLAYSPDGTRLASASRDGTARIFDPATGEMICAFREHTGPVFAVTFVGDGTQAASAGREGHVRFWTTDKGDQKSDLKDIGGEVFKLNIAGDKMLASAADGSVREISVSERKVAKRWNGDASATVLCVAAHAGSGLIVSGLSNGKLVIWKPESTDPVASYVAFPLAVKK